MTPVALPRQRVRPDVDRRVVRVGGDQQVVDAEPQCAGVPGVADDLAVTVLPQALPHRAALRDNRVEPTRPAVLGEHGLATVMQGPGGDAVRVA